MDCNIAFGNKFKGAKQPRNLTIAFNARENNDFRRIACAALNRPTGGAHGFAYWRHCRRNSEILLNSAAESGPKRRERRKP